MFTQRLKESFCEHRQRVAIQFAHRSYTYAELDQLAHRAAALYQTNGVERGERVVLYLTDKESFLLAYLGALWAGAVPLPLNPGFKSPEVTYFANDSGAVAIVHDDSTAVVSDAVQTGCPTVRHRFAAEQIRNAPTATRSLADPFQANDSALMLYSSGTTGEPKGVVHTQSNLLRAVQSIATAWRFTPDDVLGNVLPLFHIHGLSFATNVCLLSGASMYVAPEFHPIRTLDLIDLSTVFMAVPPYYYALLKRPEFRTRARTWTRLRLATCGSAPIRADVLPELESVLGRPVINRYGMTECHVLTSLPLDGPWPSGSVGTPLDGIELTVRRSDGQPCPPEEPGRVVARGPNLFRTYWGRPEATRTAFDPQGWFDTGDVGHVSRTGFLTLVGRSTELIIVGGFNVYPAMVERVINACPGVRESAVVGIPDDTRGERVAAVVVPADDRLDARTVRSFCRERLVDYQCPARIEFVADLPRNAMGKVVKRELRVLVAHAAGPTPTD